MSTQVEEADEMIQSLAYTSGNTAPRKAELESKIAELNVEKERLAASIPQGWTEAREQFTKLNGDLTKAQREYYTVTDGAYEVTQNLSSIIAATSALNAYKSELDGLKSTILKVSKDDAMDVIKAS